MLTLINFSHFPNNRWPDFPKYRPSFLCALSHAVASGDLGALLLVRFRLAVVPADIIIGNVPACLPRAQRRVTIA